MKIEKRREEIKWDRQVALYTIKGPVPLSDSVTRLADF